MPLKITIRKNNKTLMAQTTGQSAFSLDALLNLCLIRPVLSYYFNTSKAEMTLNRGGETFLFTRDK
jgi:hypothetical protein